MSQTYMYMHIRHTHTYTYIYIHTWLQRLAFLVIKLEETIAF